MFDRFTCFNKLKCVNGNILDNFYRCTYCRNDDKYHKNYSISDIHYSSFMFLIFFCYYWLLLFVMFIYKLYIPWHVSIFECIFFSSNEHVFACFLIWVFHLHAENRHWKYPVGVLCRQRHHTAEQPQGVQSCLTGVPATVS